MSLSESMERVVTLADKNALLKYLDDGYMWMFLPRITEPVVTIKHYGYDSRCGWDTYLVCVDAQAVLFANGDFS